MPRGVGGGGGERGLNGRGGRGGRGGNGTFDQPLPRRDHTVYSRATVMFEAAVLIGIGTDDFAYFVMGGKEERVKNKNKSAILLFSSNTDTQMQNNSEPLPAHTMALDTCGSLIGPSSTGNKRLGTKNNNQHKHTRENKRTRTPTHTQAHGREWARGGGQAQQRHLWHHCDPHLHLVRQGAMTPPPRPRNRIISL